MKRLLSGKFYEKGWWLTYNNRRRRSKGWEFVWHGVTYQLHMEPKWEGQGFKVSVNRLGRGTIATADVPFDLNVLNEDWAKEWGYTAIGLGPLERLGRAAEEEEAEDRAKKNSKIRPPPKMLLYANRWLEALHNRAPEHVLHHAPIPIDLKGWPYLKRLGLTAAQAQRRLPRRFGVLLILRGDADVLKLRDEKGKIKADGFYDAVDPSIPPRVGIRAQKSLEEQQISALHEMGHYTQHMLSLLTDSVAGMPASSRKLPEMAPAKDKLSALLTALGPAPETDVEHARRPPEFYPRLQEEVDFFLEVLKLDLKRRRPVRGAADVHTQAGVDAYLRGLLRRFIQNRTFFQALKGYNPLAYKKAVSEFYAQGYEQAIPLVMGLQNNPRPHERGKAGWKLVREPERAGPLTIYTYQRGSLLMRLWVTKGRRGGGSRAVLFRSVEDRRPFAAESFPEAHAARHAKRLAFAWGDTYLSGLEAFVLGTVGETTTDSSRGGAGNPEVG